MLVIVEWMMLAPGKLSGTASQMLVAACREMTDTGPTGMRPPHRRMTGGAAMIYGHDVGALCCSRASSCSPVSNPSLACDEDALC